LSSWSGAGRIIRFNWPSYAAAAAVMAVAAAAASRPGAWRVPACAALAMTAYFSAASVAASHWIYDVSPLSDWRWVPEWLGASPGRWFSIQTGFDPTNGRLRALLPPTTLPTVDLYGEPGVGGASVERARAENAADARGAASALPRGEAVCDTIVAAFALHEVRGAAARAELFRALAAALSSGGRLLVVEHLRDAPNFFAFGPGFLHFLPEGEWRRPAAGAGLSLEREASITPFVRAFLWRKP
jgi:hypothetical protein